MVARRAHNPEVVGSSPASATNSGEMAEWSIAAVLKTAEGHTSGGSNPSLSAHKRDVNFGIPFNFFELWLANWSLLNFFVRCWRLSVRSVIGK